MLRERRRVHRPGWKRKKMRSKIMRVLRVSLLLDNLKCRLLSVGWLGGRGKGRYYPQPGLDAAPNL